MSTQQPITRFTLERYLAGELGDELRAAVESECERDPGLAKELGDLRADQEAFLSEVPYAAFRVEHEKRKEQRGAARWSLARLWPVLSLAAAAGVVMLVALPQGDNPGAQDPTERIKGAGVALEFAVLDAGRLRVGTVGEALSQGATIQLSYDAGQASHMALVGVDGAGAVQVYFPESSQVMGGLPFGRQGRVPFSLTLDSVLGVERFFAVYANAPERLDLIRDAARQIAQGDLRSIGRLPLPPRFTQASVWVRKE